AACSVVAGGPACSRSTSFVSGQDGSNVSDAAVGTPDVALDTGPDVIADLMTAPETQVADGGSAPIVAAIAGGNSEFNCALLTDGTVRCWGNNNYGQLGDGTTIEHNTPVAVVGLTGVAEIAVGSAHVCARVTDGTVRCWGYNGNGQLGDGTM